MPNDEVRTIRTMPDGTTTVTVRVLTDGEQARFTDRQLLRTYMQIQDPSAAQTIRAFQVFLRRYA